VPIQPIDLQTLFMRLNQVGKEQAAQKEAAHVAQETKGSEIAKRSQDQTHSVNQTKDLEEGPNAVKDEEQKKEEPESGTEDQPDQDDKKTAKKRVYQDPALGTKIDISG
jgi:hypothetical protein